VDLDELPLVDVRRYDAVYRRDLAFRGVSLPTLLASLSPPASSDLALLHFANGMAIPLPFRDLKVIARLDPWIARSCRTKNDVKLPTGTFPSLTRKNSIYLDVPTTKFVGNKVVVAERWHPALPESAKDVFSPWQHADSLVGVEFIQSRPYYDQFDVGSAPDAKAGFEIFKQTCGFCHGARKVGAKFGWDMVEPLPLYQYRPSGRRLHDHVAFRPFDAVNRNVMMPALKFMSQEDAGKVWLWLKAIGTTPLRPYAPTATAAK
jgi:mono/diheme cytochrome c family protein